MGTFLLAVVLAVLAFLCITGSAGDFRSKHGF
jgi:hypothetical protein